MRQHRPATRPSDKALAKEEQHLHQRPSDVLDHATSEIASGSEFGIDATKKFPRESFKRPWPPLIKMDVAVRRKINQLSNR